MADLDRKSVKKIRKTPSKFMRASGTTPRTPASAGSQRSARMTPGTPTDSERLGSGVEEVYKHRAPTVKLADGREVELIVADYSNQALTSMPDGIWEKTNIGILDVSANNISQIGSGISKLAYLHEIHANNTSIRCGGPADFESMSRNMAKLHFLTKLSIQCCNLVFVPPVIFDIRNLAELYLNRNRIYQLPADIGKLKKLKKLNLQLTGLTTLPPQIAYCQELEELTLFGNPMQTMPETVAELTKLHTLNMSYRVFTVANVDAYMENLIRKQQIQSEHISPVVFELQSLREMDLSLTKINTFPNHKLQSLNRLDLSNNYIRILPDSIVLLRQLRELNLSNNQLASLPNQFGDLVTFLRSLKIAGNQFRKIPEQVFELTNLRELDCSRNEINEIPLEITKLSKLRRLGLAKNNITKFPDYISRLNRLETLDIRNNHIVEIPGSVYKMESLNVMHNFEGLDRAGLWLLRNPELAIPPPIIWLGDDIGLLCDSIRRLAIQSLSKTQLNPTRLVLLGDNDEVKTAIAKRLLGIRYMERNSQVCSIHRWVSRNGVPFIIFDLHTSSEATRDLLPIFFAPNSIVLLTFDFNNTEQTTSPLEPWLDVVSVCAPGAVLKLIGVSVPEESLQAGSTSICNQRTRIEVMRYVDHITNGLEVFQAAKYGLQTDSSKIPALKRIEDLALQRFSVLNEWKERQMLIRSCREVTLLDTWSNADRWEELEWQMELLATNPELSPHVQVKVDRKWHELGRRLAQKKHSLVGWSEVVEEATLANVNFEELPEALKFLENCCTICRYIYGKWVTVRPHKLLISIEPILGKAPIVEPSILKHRARFPEDKFTEALDVFSKKGDLCEPLLKSALFYPTFGKLTSMEIAEKTLEEFGLGYVRYDQEFQNKPHLQSWFTTSIVKMTRDTDETAEDDKKPVNEWPPEPQSTDTVKKLNFWPVIGNATDILQLFKLLQVRIHQAAWLFLASGPRKVAAEIRQTESEFTKAYVVVTVKDDGEECHLEVLATASDDLYISWALDVVANTIIEFYALYPGVLLSTFKCHKNDGTDKPVVT